MSFLELFLFESDVTEAPPGIIMRLVSFESSLVISFALVVIFISNELVTAKSMSVGEILI